MAISFRSASSTATLTDIATSITGSAPAGTAATDVLIAFINTRSGSSQTFTPPTGWTLVRRTNEGTNQAVASYWALGTVSDFSWSYDTASAATLHILAIQGADTVSADPVDIDGGTANASASTSVNAASITTTSANTLLCYFGCQNADATYTPPSGMTERTDQTSGALSNPLSGETATLVLSAAGATGAKAATSTQSAASVAQLVAVQMLSEGRVSQEATEVLLSGTPDARISQEAVEVLINSSTVASRISQIAIEVLLQNIPAAKPIGKPKSGGGGTGGSKGGGSNSNKNAQAMLAMAAVKLLSHQNKRWTTTFIYMPAAPSASSESQPGQRKLIAAKSFIF